MRIEFGKEENIDEKNFFFCDRFLIILSITFEVIMLPLYKQIFL